MARFLLLWWRCLLRWLFGMAIEEGHRFGRRVHCPRPPWQARRKPDWVADRLVHYKAAMPEAGCRRIADTFNRAHAACGITVGKTFVADVLRRRRHAVEQRRRQLRRRQARRGPRNQVWGLDLTGKGDEIGRIHDIMGLIDHGTRLSLLLATLPRRCSWALLGHLCLAIAKHGKPKALRTDNASVFTSRFFRTALALLGIQHQLSEIGCPWQNGRIERFFGTLKQALDCWAVVGAAELAASLRQFEVWYNEIRPHQSLNGWTPYETWHGIDPYAKPPRRIEWFSAWDGLLTGFVMRR